MEAVSCPTDNSRMYSARFRHSKHDVEVHGFYDGNGKYFIRFSPDELGDWTYETSSNSPELVGKKGSFRAIAPSKSNHRPVIVRDRFHFAYADEKPYIPIGTTCYAWTHQSEALEVQTLATDRDRYLDLVVCRGF